MQQLLKIKTVLKYKTKKENVSHKPTFPEDNNLVFLFSFFIDIQKYLLLAHKCRYLR